MCKKCKPYGQFTQTHFTNVKATLQDCLGSEKKTNNKFACPS